MLSSNVTVQYVSEPTEDLVEEAVKVFSDLMPEDPLTISLVAGDRRLIPTMARAMIKPIALVVGDMYTATDESGKLAGFTLWLPPGRNLYDTGKEQLEMGYLDLMDKLPEEGRAYFAETMGKDFPKVIDSKTGIESTELNTYWCSFAFVKAEYQGKGVTRAMFELAFEKAKRLGATMALATTAERNVAIYQKLGFELKGYELMPSQWMPWPVWIFARDANTI
ncbi:uncharacterized protein LAESUDRAFT_723445 [Laetiporus sulphureus 93-53]|uniref:N-acetyltransferase domain-containing protein n=1 Tax=Laetiporus sulphureus 93-53 TaxID=1314785 RepID=A0A165F8C6_9APHY|nr:uncharacterized protein LAESUDRAFT_723445 [Laetiporus sulphureus 93-53]KZT08580.1 hypothetical protein LAESUDRAFT_723445 [Laetiporus sulphureus 93-53]